MPSDLDAEWQRAFERYIAIPNAIPLCPHLSEVRGEPVLSHSGAAQSITRYDPWIGWLVDAPTKEEKLGIEEVVRQACRLLGYNYCWIRDTAVNVSLTPSGAELLRDLHIPVYLGCHGEVTVEGQIFCVAGADGIPARMMYPEERFPQPAWPIELWLFSQSHWSDRYIPINVSRFFSHLERLRPRIPIVDVEAEEDDYQEAIDWDMDITYINSMVGEAGPDPNLISFDEDEANAP